MRKDIWLKSSVERYKQKPHKQQEVHIRSRQIFCHRSADDAADDAMMNRRTSASSSSTSLLFLLLSLLSSEGFSFSHSLRTAWQTTTTPPHFRVLPATNQPDFGDLDRAALPATNQLEFGDLDSYSRSTFDNRQSYLQKCMNAEEGDDESLERELREMGMTEELIGYTMSERRKRKTPPVGTPAYKGLTEWWCARFNIDID